MDVMANDYGGCLTCCQQRHASCQSASSSCKQWNEILTKWFFFQSTTSNIHLCGNPNLLITSQFRFTFYTLSLNICWAAKWSPSSYFSRENQKLKCHAARCILLHSVLNRQLWNHIWNLRIQAALAMTLNNIWKIINQWNVSITQQQQL